MGSHSKEQGFLPSAQARSCCSVALNPEDESERRSQLSPPSAGWQRPGSAHRGREQSGSTQEGELSPSITSSGERPPSDAVDHCRMQKTHWCGRQSPV